MIRTKFRENLPADSGKEDFECFYHIRAWRPSWSCDPDFSIKLFFDLPMDAPHKISL